MFGFVKNLFDYNQKELNRIQKIVDQINILEDDARDLKDADFKKETEKLKKQVQRGEKILDDILPWAYALVREASRRVLGLRHYDVQLIAGIALHEGKVAEQKTGEGKTLSATAPLYLNALMGRGVHLVTVNDYLARRDAGWMGQVYDFLGLSVSAMISEKSFIFDVEYFDETASDWRLIHLKPLESRKEAYLADITYGINSEFGFDYLRDNMAKEPENVVQRDFYYSIIDEVDSVLIDEARTPHIISAAVEQDVSKYYDYAKNVERLDDTDYILDEKTRTAHLNDKGIEKLEKLLGYDNIYEEDYEALYHVEAALKARTLFKKDKDYIVRNNEVIIVDEFTGRLLEGRRFSEGLHQAIEAKERVEIKRESKTLATVSLQNYFRMYDKLAGMTGTASTEAEEFNKIYKLETLVIPTHIQVTRKDLADLIYKTERGKFTALVDEIAKIHAEGRPVLVGTSAIDKNELLSRLLKKKGVKHEVLNAKNHEREAHIIANAGKKGAITIATNMAGRGVDIVLGGETPNKFERNIKDDSEKTRKKMEKAYEDAKKEWQKQHDEVVALGGLYVIGTERHESRRIDNQLRGRAGRQGDPGTTRFFVSLEDDMMRIFGGEQVAKMMDFFKLPEDQPLEHMMVSKALEQAQTKVEGHNFDIRKHLVEYDDVLNKQRDILYKMRQAILFATFDDPQHLEDEVERAFSEQVESLLNMYVFVETEPDFEKFAEELDIILPASADKLIETIQSSVTSREDAADMALKMFKKLYAERKKEVGNEVWTQVVKFIFLDISDKLWTDHLTAIEDLRQGINLRGYAQLDPLTEYKNEAFSMFEKLLNDISFDFVRRIFQIKVTSEEAVTEQMKVSVAEDAVYSAAEQKNSLKEPISAPTQPIQASQRIDEAEIVREPEVGSHNHDDHDHVHNHDHSHDHDEQQFGFKVTAPGQSVKKPDRNDPCWCGSGKKYKKCHYPN